MRYLVKFFIVIFLCCFICSCNNKKDSNIVIIRDSESVDTTSVPSETSSIDKSAINNNVSSSNLKSNISDKEVTSNNEVNSGNTISRDKKEEYENVLSRDKVINMVIEYIKCSTDTNLKDFKFLYCNKDCKVDLLSKEKCLNVVVSICAGECKDNSNSYIIYFSSDYENGDDVDYKTGVLLVDVSNMRISSIKVVNFE